MSTPASRAIEAFGGAAELAEAVGRSVSRIHRWTYPKSRGGTDGEIPGGTKMLTSILAAARDRQIPLSIGDLVLNGRHKSTLPREQTSRRQAPPPLNTTPNGGGV